MISLSTLFVCAAGLALLGVVVSLVGGVGAMTRGQKKDQAASNKMMQMRVICQGLVLFFLFMAYVAK